MSIIAHLSITEAARTIYRMAEEEHKELQGLRGQIDRKDMELLTVLMERMRIVERIGEYKRKNKLEIRDEEREKEILRDRPDRGSSRALSRDMVREIFKSIIAYAKERE